MNNFEQEERYLRAKSKLDKIKGFHSHLVAYVIINIFLIGFFYWAQGRLTFASFSTAFFWGIGLMIHGVCVYGKTILFGSNWEQRKIQEFMDKEKEQSHE